VTIDHAVFPAWPRRASPAAAAAVANRCPRARPVDSSAFHGINGFPRRRGAPVIHPGPPIYSRVPNNPPDACYPVSPTGRVASADATPSLRRIGKAGSVAERKGLGPWVSLREGSQAGEFERKPSSLSRGTEGSNPPPSSSESIANLTFGAHLAEQEEFRSNLRRLLADRSPTKERAEPAFPRQ
jgi:hypothetical protein